MPLNPHGEKQPGHLVSFTKCSKSSVGKKIGINYYQLSPLEQTEQTAPILQLWVTPLDGREGKTGWWCNPQLFHVPHLPKRKKQTVLPGKVYRSFVQERTTRAIGTDLWLSSQEGRRRVSVGRADRPRALLCSTGDTRAISACWG